METIFIPYVNVEITLKCNSSGEFVNKNGEYCQVSYSYNKDRKTFLIVFKQPSGPMFTASRYAINTVSEKKVRKLLNDEEFILVKKTTH